MQIQKIKLAATFQTCKNAQRMTESTESGMVYKEVHAVVKRYLSEGDLLTAFGVMGALEAVKLDVADMLRRHNEQEEIAL